MTGRTFGAQSMKPVEGLIHQLRQRAQLNPGATPSELESLRSLLGVELPEDVAAFYSLANGMPDLAHDDHHVSFWSIEKICTRAVRWDDNRIAFADFLFDSWRFIFSSSARGVVVTTENVGPGKPLEEIGTLDEFATIYLRHPTQLRIL